MARLGALAASEVIQRVADALLELPPGGVWGRTYDLEGTVLDRAAPAFRSQVEERLFAAPGSEWTGMVGRWKPVSPEVTAAAAARGLVAWAIELSWPRPEDAPIVKGRGDAAPVGLLGADGRPVEPVDRPLDLELGRPVIRPDWGRGERS